MLCFWQQLLYLAALNLTSESSRTRTVLQSISTTAVRLATHRVWKGRESFRCATKTFWLEKAHDLLEEMLGFRCWLKNEYLHGDFTSVLSSGETTLNCRRTINQQKACSLFLKKNCRVSFAGVYKGVFIAVKLCWLENVMQIYFSSVLNWSLRKQSKLYPF